MLPKCQLGTTQSITTLLPHTQNLELINGCSLRHHSPCPPSIVWASHSVELWCKVCHTVHVRVAASDGKCGYWLVWWLGQCLVVVHTGRKPRWQGPLMLQHIGLYVTVQYVVCTGYMLCDSVLHTYIHMQVVTVIAVAHCSIQYVPPHLCVCGAEGPP